MGRRKVSRETPTFVILHVEGSEMRMYSGDAAREIIRGVIELAAEKLPRIVEDVVGERTGGVDV